MSIRGPHIQIQLNHHGILRRDSSDFELFDPTQFSPLAMHNSEYDADRELYAVLQMEQFNQFGIEISYYCQSYDKTHDKVFGEDGNRKWERVFECMGKPESLPTEQSQYGATAAVWLDQVDEVKIHFNKLHFESASATNIPILDPTTGQLGVHETTWSESFNHEFLLANWEKDRSGAFSDDFSDSFDIGEPLVNWIPKKGDLVQLQYNSKFYEVTDVVDTESMFLGGKHTWTLTMKPWKRSKQRVGNQNNLSELTAILGDDDIFDDSQFIDDSLHSEEECAPTFPTTGKGKPTPIYKPLPLERPPKDVFGGQ
jgi:hypothetical protein